MIIDFDASVRDRFEERSTSSIDLDHLLEGRESGERGTIPVLVDPPDQDLRGCIEPGDGVATFGLREAKHRLGVRSGGGTAAQGDDRRFVSGERITQGQALGLAPGDLAVTDEALGRGHPDDLGSAVVEIDEGSVQNPCRRTTGGRLSAAAKPDQNHMHGGRRFERNHSDGGQSLATGTASTVDDLPPALGGHAGAKAHLADLLDAAGLAGVVECHDGARSRALVRRRIGLADPDREI